MKPEFIGCYLNDLESIVSKLDRTTLKKAVDILTSARDSDNTIYTCGNGGSASIASQMVVDILKGGSYKKQKRFRIIGLTDSISTITAYANDVSYDCVFEEQLRNYARSGDVLIAISGSGNSRNILKAVEYAKHTGCKTIGLTTAQGGKLKDAVDLALTVPSTHMGRLEDCFFIMTHILCYAFIED
jgi:D-sedoheptulose 7-phosphate isomerase